MSGHGHARKRLNHPCIALVTSLVLLTGTAARAEYLATGAVFGGPSQFSANCYVFNVGPPITIVAAEIRNQKGAIVTTSNTCTRATLAQFATCGVSATSLTFQTYECDVETSGTNADLRGVMDIRNGASDVLINSNLR
jgi:hypothetical protein